MDKESKVFKDTENSKRDENTRYHLFSGDFEFFDFKKLYDEKKNKTYYKNILWSNKGSQIITYIDENGRKIKNKEKQNEILEWMKKNNKKIEYKKEDDGSITKEINKDGCIIKINEKINKQLKNIKKDDIVYIIYKKLPDGSNRILIKCVVEDPDYEYGYFGDEDEKREFEEGRKAKIPGIILEYKTALCVETNRDKFTKENLTTKYGINSTQGKQHLYEDLVQINNNGKEGHYQKELIQDLEEEASKGVYTLGQLKNYFNEISKCTLCELGKKSDHPTFKKENGMNYFEVHHLIQQCNISKYKEYAELSPIVYNPINEITICSNCHRRIHNGNKEDRKKLIQEIYNKGYNEEKKQNDFDDLLKQIQEKIPEIIKQEKGNNDEEKRVNWLLNQYLKK